MNLAALLLVGVGLGLVGEADPEATRHVSSLIAELGAPRYADREAAADALRALGRDALPALRTAREDRDAEVKGRARVLLDAIERELLTRPTLVTVVGRDRPMGLVLAELGRNSGFRLDLAPTNNPTWVDRPVDLRLEDPIPFWRALDRLGVVAELDPEFDAFGQGSGSGLKLQPRRGKGPPTADSGPFRVILQDAEYAGPAPFRIQAAARNRPFQARPARNSFDLSVKLDVLAEPRLWLRPEGPVRILEAVDDEGTEFAQKDQSAFEAGERGLPGMTMPVVLTASSRPSRRLARLRGTIPVTLEARRLEPMAISLAPGAERTSIDCGEVFLLIMGLTDQPFRRMTRLELCLRPTRFQPGAFRRGGRFMGDIPDSPEMDRILRSLEIVDSRGRVLPARPPQRLGADPAGWRMAIDLPQSDAFGPPSQVHLYGVTRTKFEVPFAFTNVPLPPAE